VQAATAPQVKPSNVEREPGLDVAMLGRPCSRDQIYSSTLPKNPCSITHDQTIALRSPGLIY